MGGSIKTTPRALVSSELNYWVKKPAELYKELQFSPQGLTKLEAEGRVQKYASNTLQSRQELTPIKLFLNQFKSPIVLILLFATILSAFLADWTDAIIILIIMLGSVILSFFQENYAHNAANGLRAHLTLITEVMSDGLKKEIPMEDVVSGDVITFKAGSLVPADGVVVDAKDLFVSQAMIFMTLLLALIDIGLPYTPLAAVMEFTLLSLKTLGIIAMVIILYFISAELVKRRFFHRFEF